jgi:uncharacterized protein (DUF433 family)
VLQRVAPGGYVLSVTSDSHFTYLNVGMYTVPEASRLTGVSRGRIRRWLKGYHSTLRHKNYSALWTPQLPQPGKGVVLGFLDLIEVKFVGAFLDRGVSWRMIHKVREKASRLYPRVSHPFCTKGFVTDGQRVFAEVHRQTGEKSLLDIATDQHLFAEITRPFLKQLEFRDGSMLERWWPMGRARQVVLDPRKNFGQPTIFRDGIVTQVLAQSVRANGSIEVVARWFEISPESVQDAVDYELSLAA